MIVVPVETEALSVDNILWHVEVWGCFQLSSGSQRISTVGQHDSGDYHGHHDTCRSGQQTSIHQGPWVTGLFLGIISKCKCVCVNMCVCVCQSPRRSEVQHWPCPKQIQNKWQVLASQTKMSWTCWTTTTIFLRCMSSSGASLTNPMKPDNTSGDCRPQTVPHVASESFSMGCYHSTFMVSLLCRLAQATNKWNAFQWPSD